MTKEARLDAPERDDASTSGDGSKESGTTRISRSAEPVEAERADYNLRIVVPLAHYVTDKCGKETLERLAADLGAPVEAFDGRAYWVSAEKFEGFLEEVYRLAGGTDDGFMQASTHRMNEAYGPLRYLLWAASPSAVYQQAVSSYRVLSRIGDPEIVSRDRTSLHMRIKWFEPISRKTCLLRQAQCAALPTIWGLPKAYVREDACLANGDATCELHFNWYERSRIIPVLFGGALGALIAMLVVHFAAFHYGIFGAMTLAGLLAGYVRELRRTEQVNTATQSRVMDALRQLALEELEARREIFALGQRQRDWAAVVEEAYTSRVDGLQGVMKQAEEMQSARESTLLGFSHDLRNPLMVLASTVEFLRDNTEALGDEGPGVIEDVESSITQMKRMLGDFVSAATSKKAIVRFSPQKLDVAILTTSLTRRLRALLQGRPIVPSVMRTREAPDAIYFDPLIFDRVTDNLLTNAAKYTERGSIVVEITGNDEFIVIQVSDSGRGIDEVELERIFQPGGSSKDRRARDSFGVGLSVVLQLLEQVGGSLEVMSQPGRGTTFWANFPIGSEATLRPSVRPSLDSSTNERAAAQNPLSGRVRIRKPPA